MAGTRMLPLSIAIVVPAETDAAAEPDAAAESDAEVVPTAAAEQSTAVLGAQPASGPTVSVVAAVAVAVAAACIAMGHQNWMPKSLHAAADLRHCYPYPQQGSAPAGISAAGRSTGQVDKNWSLLGQEERQNRAKLLDRSYSSTMPEGESRSGQNRQQRTLWHSHRCHYHN